VIEFRFLGGFSIRSGAIWREGPPPKRGRELLQYLGAYPRRVATHDALAEAFWPGLPLDEVTHRIHLAASGARGYLRSVLEGRDAIRRAPGGYTWDAEIRISSDVDDLLRLSASESSDDSLRSAVAVYGGEFLAGEPAQWVQPLRIRCASAYALAIETLAERAVRAGDHAQALAYGLQLMDADPSHEAAARLAMRCFAVLGQRSRGLECFLILQAHLQHTLGIAPADETTALAHELRCENAPRAF
jgi:DNA-binding SARP family transcriptional activator